MMMRLSLPFLRCNWPVFLDIDECATGRVSCPRFRQCANTFGSYICKCHAGFDLMYIGGKYQCHGKGTVPFLCKLSAGRTEKSPAVVITGLLGQGGGYRHEKSSVCLTHQSFWSHVYRVSSVHRCFTWTSVPRGVHSVLSRVPPLVFLPPTQTSTSVPWGSTSAAALPDVTTSTGPTSVNVETATRATDGTVCVSKSCPGARVFRKYGLAWRSLLKKMREIKLLKTWFSYLLTSTYPITSIQSHRMSWAQSGGCFLSAIESKNGLLPRHWSLLNLQ